MAKEAFIDPICGMTVEPSTAAGSYEHDGTTYYFCSKGCMQKFIAQTSTEPPVQAPVQIGRAKHDHHDHHAHHEPAGEVKDPVCGMTVDPATAAASFEYDGTTYHFCAVRCKEKFAANPEQFLSRDGEHSRHPGDIGSTTESQIPNPNSQIVKLLL